MEDTPFRIKEPGLIQAIEEMNNGNYKKDKELVGQTFTNWTVLKRSEHKSSAGGRKWDCICKCGAEKTLTTSEVLVPDRKCCKKCNKGRASRKWRGYGGVSKYFWSKVVHSAQKRNLSMTVTIEEVWNKFESQEGKCALSGVQLLLKEGNPKKGEAEQTASLDRIDSSKGYEPGNVQWLHKTVNIMKQKLPDKDLINWCKLIVEHSHSSTLNPISTQNEAA